MAAIVDWTWLYATPNGIVALQELDSDVVTLKRPRRPTDLPVAVRCIVLVTELSLVSGGAFMLLLTSSSIGVLVRSPSHVLLAATANDPVVEDTFVQICETVAFGYGLVASMSCFFRRSKQDLAQRLTGCGWCGVKTISVSVAIHSAAILVLVLLQEQAKVQVLVSWCNVEAAMHQSDRPLATAEIVQNLLLAPVKEELFFRGAVVLVTINRMQSVKWSAAVSAILFATIHLANTRHVGAQYSVSYVAFQVLWAFLVGLFLALKFAVSGSVVVCLVLHVINNTFALAMSKTTEVSLTHPLVAFSVIAAVVIYCLAITKQLQRLRPVQLKKQL
uniref:CAAX prenyl protease 2/Lysostaphin resistance protein A-like domain-containing protein n=1 Tax=Peronospora matthiolae TaxID=2874970 RepID=A0AAV1VNQ8_9STRA